MTRVLTLASSSACAARLRRARAAIVLGAVVLALAGGRASAQPVAAEPAAAPSTSAPAADSSTDSAQDLARRHAEALIQTLLSDATPQPARDEAARRLSVRDDEASRTALLSALQSASSGAQLAVARALADQVQPDPRFIDALFPLLEGDRAHAEAAARALAQLADSPDVLRGLIDVLGAPKYSDAARVAAARALGTVVDQRAAAALMSRLLDTHEHPAVRDAAAAALADLTGRNDIGADTQAWQHWWQQAQSMKDAEFRQTYLTLDRKRDVHERRRLDSLIASLENEFDAQFHAAAAPERDALLLHLLGSQEPQFRAAGAVLVARAAEEAIPVPTQAREQLRSLVGDASVPVRRDAAEALARLNDPQALDDLLAQLQIETDPTVRAALALALAPIGDVRAQGALERLLADDQPDDVAIAGADGLAGLGATLRRDHPNDAAALARRLRDVLRHRTGAGGHDELRAALIRALVPLRDQEVLQDLITNDGILNASREADIVRVAAVSALGELADARFVDTLGRTALDDPSPAVRRAAVIAVQQNPSAKQLAEPIFDRLMSPDTEPDANVRDTAWTFEQSVLDQLDPSTLALFANAFKGRNEIDRQVRVLQVLTKKLKETGSDDLRGFLQELGEAYMTLNRYDEAANAFNDALLLARQKNVPVQIEALSERELDALLLTRNYVKAIAFAEQMLNQSNLTQETVGDRIKIEADNLLRAGGPANLAAARDLLNRALNMSAPPLADSIQQRLKEDLPAPQSSPGG